MGHFYGLRVIRADAPTREVSPDSSKSLVFTSAFPFPAEARA